MYLSQGTSEFTCIVTSNYLHASKIKWMIINVKTLFVFKKSNASIKMSNHPHPSVQALHFFWVYLSDQDYFNLILVLGACFAPQI
jgi:hypothetical protein